MCQQGFFLMAQLSKTTKSELHEQSTPLSCMNRRKWIQNYHIFMLTVGPQLQIKEKKGKKHHKL